MSQTELNEEELEVHDHIVDDQQPVEESRDPSAGNERAQDSSMMTAFRDFFLAAFCDQACSDVYCCAGRVSPQHSAVDPKQSAFQDPRRSPRLKKPLAVAVGYNYANDMNGRPVVIRPGKWNDRSGSATNSRSGSRNSSRQSPSSISKTNLAIDSQHNLEHNDQPRYSGNTPVSV
jgi:hypothetical protein